jgi:DNA-binding MarR family transcriptional regulator
MSDLSKLHAGLLFCLHQHSQLRISQLHLLLTVALKPGQTQTELAVACDLTLSAVSRAMDVLGSSGRRDKISSARMGWVETRRNPDDDRILQVYLTKKGQEFVSLLEAMIYGSSILPRSEQVESAVQA